MWWAGRQFVDVYLGTRAAGIAQAMETTRWGRVEGFGAAIADVQTFLGKSPNAPRIRVWLSGGLCQPFLIPVLEGVEDKTERHRIAVAMANRQTTLGENCEVWLDPHSSAGGRLAVAVARSLRSTVIGSLSTIGRVVSIRPWWCEVLRAALRAKSGSSLTALGVQDCDALTVLAAGGEAFDVATVVAPVSEGAASRAAWSRALLVNDVAIAGAKYAWLDLDAKQGPSALHCAFGSAVRIIHEGD